MQEEVNEKTISLCIKGGKITAQILKAALIKLLAEMDSAQIDATLPGWYLRGDKDGSNGSNFNSADLPKWQERDAPPV